jgi:hypothetical protein
MKRFALVLPFCLAGLLAACGPSGSEPAAPASAQVEATSAPVAVERAQAEPSAPPACQEVDFEAFLARFESSADVQRASTADPLRMTRIDADAQPEPAPSTTNVPVAEVAFPVMPDAATRAAEGSTLRVESRGAAAREVHIGLPDTGAQVRYEFSATPCWTLVHVDDQSI